MRYIKTFENFNPVNENWFLKAWSWIKDKLSNWISKLQGEIKQGAEAAINWIKDNPTIMEETKQKLSQQDPNEVRKLGDWVNRFSGDESQIQQMVAESSEEDESKAERLLQKIAKIVGISFIFLGCFVAPVVGFIGLATGNGLLFLIGAVVTIISYSIHSLFQDEFDDSSPSNW